MYVYAQGSAVSFGGKILGELLEFRLSPGVAQLSDATGVDGWKYGEGNERRLLKQVDCTTVDPGTVSVRLLGCPPYKDEDIGSRGALVVSFMGGSFSMEAILTKFEVEGSVGDLLRGSAEFAFTGA